MQKALRPVCARSLCTQLCSILCNKIYEKLLPFLITSTLQQLTYIWDTYICKIVKQEIGKQPTTVVEDVEILYFFTVSAAMRSQIDIGFSCVLSYKYLLLQETFQNMLVLICKFLYPNTVAQMRTGINYLSVVPLHCFACDLFGEVFAATGEILAV